MAKNKGKNKQPKVDKLIDNLEKIDESIEVKVKKPKVEKANKQPKGTGVICKCGTEMDLVVSSYQGNDYKCPKCKKGKSLMGGI